MNIKPKLQNFISNDDEWNILKLYFMMPFMFIGFWTWGMRPEAYLFMNYIWIGFEILIGALVGMIFYYQFKNLRKWNLKKN